MWKDKLFWFSQPSPILNSYDNYFLWAFAALVALGVLLRVVSGFLMKHAVVAKVVGKFGNSFWVAGLIGILWYGLRYENTPFFADRYWVLVIGLVLVIRLLFILKYLLLQFGSEKQSYDRMQLNSKYIPGKK